MKVEVDIEDLETIVFATGVIKTIEGALQSRKQDPFVQPHLEYSKAHNNLVAAMNSARRSENTGTAIAWDGKLDDKELKMLVKFSAAPVITITGEFRFKFNEIDRLLSKGCIRMGQRVEGAVWPGEPKADIRPTEDFAVAITQRGKDKLEKLLHENKS